MRTDPSLVISVLSVVAAGTSALYAWKQHRISERAVELSERSARAAEESAKAASAAGDFGSRAWVTVSKVEIRQRDELKVPRSARATYLNSGTTPALDVESQAWLRAFRVAPGSFPLHERAVVRHQDLGAGCADKIEALASFDDSGSRHIVGGMMTLYFYGQLSYSDVSRRQHTVNWCYQYLPRTLEFHPVTIGISTSGR